MSEPSATASDSWQLRERVEQLGGSLETRATPGARSGQRSHGSGHPSGTRPPRPAAPNNGQ